MSIIIEFNAPVWCTPYVDFDVDKVEGCAWYEKNMSLEFGIGPFRLCIQNYSESFVFNNFSGIIERLVDKDRDKFLRLMELACYSKGQQYTEREFTRIIQDIRDN